MTATRIPAAWESARQAPPEPTTPAEILEAAQKADASIDLADLLDDLHDCGEWLQPAIAARDEAKIGRIILAVRDAYVERLTDRLLWGVSWRPDAQAAARAAAEATQ